ncbi:MAG: chorismate--pyruvate lyase family protein [Saccharospirillum sp.]
MTSINPDTLDFQWLMQDTAAASIPPASRYWVQLPGSLTRALRERTEAFNVRVIEEGPVVVARPPASLSDAGTRFWSRKVQLRSETTPWVLAHTLIPQSSLDAGLQRLTELHNRPLGELLFTVSGVRKDAREVACTPFGWARRARFWLNEQPLLVTEFFTEALINHEQQRLTALSETNPS